MKTETAVLDTYFAFDFWFACPFMRARILRQRQLPDTAFAAAIRASLPRLQAKARGLVRKWPSALRAGVDVREVAHEITQDSVAEAWKHRGQFRGDSSLDRWLCGFVKKCALRWKRKTAIRACREVPEAQATRIYTEDGEEILIEAPDLEGQEEPIRPRTARLTYTCPCCGAPAAPRSVCSQCRLGLPRDLAPDSTRYGSKHGIGPQRRQRGLVPRLMRKQQDRLAAMLDEPVVRRATVAAVKEELARHPEWVRAVFGWLRAGEMLARIAEDVGLSTPVLRGKLRTILRAAERRRHSILLGGNGNGSC